MTHSTFISYLHLSLYSPLLFPISTFFSSLSNLLSTFHSSILSTSQFLIPSQTPPKFLLTLNFPPSSPLSSLLSYYPLSSHAFSSSFSVSPSFTSYISSFLSYHYPFLSRLLFSSSLRGQGRSGSS